MRAGGFGPDLSASPVSTSVNGSTVTFTMGNFTFPDLTSYTDYDSGSHSSAGVLNPFGPMIVTATIGSTIATLNGYALVATDAPANYPVPLFNIVPYRSARLFPSP